MTQPPLQLVLRARAESLTVLREQVTTWLASIGTPEDQVGDIVLVVNEACSNSIEHAYTSGVTGVIRVSADVDSQSICVTVEDFGRWKTDTSKTDISRGRGIPLMRAMSAHVGMHTNTNGTRVSLTFRSPAGDGDPTR